MLLEGSLASEVLHAREMMEGPMRDAQRVRDMFEGPMRTAQRAREMMEGPCVKPNVCGTCLKGRRATPSVHVR